MTLYNTTYRYHITYPVNTTTAERILLRSRYINEPEEGFNLGMSFNDEFWGINDNLHLICGTLNCVRCVKIVETETPSSANPNTTPIYLNLNEINEDEW